MDILTSIQAQIDVVRLPLYAVSVSAVRSPDTPLLLLLHWHGFRPEAQRERAGRPRRAAVPGTALQLNSRWHTLEEIEGAMLDAAWQLGAWDLERSVRRGCGEVGASAQEAHECRQAFGDNPLAPGSDAHLVLEAPDRDELMQAAARRGYVRWLFRPVRAGLWRAIAEDDTLNAEGGRTPPCPVMPRQVGEPGRAPQVYRLGRVRRLVLPGLPPS